MDRRALSKRIGIGLVARGWTQVAATIFALVTARVIGLTEFGFYAIANVFVVILQALIYGGIYDYLIRNQSKDVDKDTCFWMNLCFGAAGATLIGGLAPIMGHATGSADLTVLMAALAPSNLVAALASWQEALLLRQGRFSTYYRLSILNDTLSVSIGIAALLLGAGIWSFVIYRYSQLTLATLGYFAAVREIPRLKWSGAAAATVIRFAGSLYASKGIGMLAAYGADLLIGLAVNPAAAGAYRLASRIVQGVSDIVFQPVGSMAWVHFAKSGTDQSALRREWLHLLVAVSLIVWPAMAGLALLNRSIVHIVVGPGWDEAAPVIAILAVSRMVAIFQVFLDPILAIRDRTRTILTIRTAASVGLMLVLVFTARYGAAGAALGQLAISVALAVPAVGICLAATGVAPGALCRALLPGTLGTVAALGGAVLVLAMPSWSASLIVQIGLAAIAGMAAWGLVLTIAFRHQLRSFRQPVSPAE